MSHDPCAYVVSCEHGGNDVPADWSHLFQSPGAQQALSSHRGYDCGALPAAVFLADVLTAPLVTSTDTRLLVDLNRSLDNVTLWSKFTRGLSDAEQTTILSRFYHPYRERVANRVEQALLKAEQVIHISVHTFAPRMQGRWRPLDVGLLYDPAFTHESSFCSRWRSRLIEVQPRLRVMLNQPYSGSDDGLTTYLRRRLKTTRYLGLEVEINSRYYKRCERRFSTLVEQLALTLAAAMPAQHGDSAC